MGKRSALTSPKVTKRHQAQTQQQLQQPQQQYRLQNLASSHIPNGTPAQAPYSTKAAETWIAIGDCATTMGIIVTAVRAFQLALVHAPGSLDALIGWSHLLRMNDIAANETIGLQTAIQALTLAGEQYPDMLNTAAYYRELTECYLLVGLNDQAHQAVAQAIARRPEEPALQFLLAQTLIRAGARSQAAAALTHCLLLLPLSLAEFLKDDIETARLAHAELAAIAAADGNIDLLIVELTATLLLPPPPLPRADEHIALWCAFATAKERANRIPEAIDACERAEIAAGPLPRILMTHAYLLLLNDELRASAEKAVQLLTAVVDSEPEDIRRQLEKPSGEHGGDAPGDFLPWYLLGKAYTFLDAPRAAYDSYQIALRRASALPITWLAVGKLYLELKQLPDALAAYSQALRLQLNENSPGTAAAWDGLSCVYERCDDQLTDAADACLRAALCYRAFGDTENADAFKYRAKELQAAARGEGPMPSLRVPVGVPNYFLRDLVTLLPAERIAFVQGFAHRQKQDDAAAQQSKPTSQDRPAQVPVQLLPLQSQAHPPGAVAPPHQQRTPQPQQHSPHQPQQPQQQQQQQPSPPHPQQVSQGQQPPQQQHTPQPAQQRPQQHPPPPQPQYMQLPVHPQLQLPDRRVQPLPMYALSHPLRGDSKAPHGSLPPPGGAWGSGVPGNSHGLPPQHLLPGPPQHLIQYGIPPPNGVMSPSQASAAGPHRSPTGPPQGLAEGYPAPPVGFVYGQYVPMHGGMVQPYGWRR